MTVRELVSGHILTAVLTLIDCSAFNEAITKCFLEEPEERFPL